MIRRLTRAGASALLAFGGVAAAVGLTRGAEQPAYTLRSAIDRFGDPERPALAKRRPRARRTLHRDLRREGPAQGRLLRRDRRRPVEDDRRRRALGERHRRPDQELVGRRGRRLGDRSEHRFHRHGRVVHSRRHPARRRRLQVDRRRQDLDARRFRELRRDLAHPHPSDEPEHRVRRRLREIRRAERGARRLQEHRRRRRRGSSVLFTGRRDRRGATSRSTARIRTSCTRRSGRRTARSG